MLIWNTIYFINNPMETGTVSNISVMPGPGFITYILKQLNAQRLALDVTCSEKVTKNNTPNSKVLIYLPLNVYYFNLWTQIGR